MQKIIKWESKETKGDFRKALRTLWFLGEGPEWVYILSYITLPETNSSPLKLGHAKMKPVFQPSIFRAYVSFREGSILDHASY